MLRMFSRYFPSNEDIIQSTQREVDFGFVDRLMFDKAYEYLRDKRTKEYMAKYSGIDPNAHLHRDITVGRLVRAQVESYCQLLFSQLDYFAFYLLESNQNTAHLSLLKIYGQFPDVDEQAKLGLVRVDKDGQWSFVHDSFMQYCAARYITACIQDELKIGSRYLAPSYAHRWICNLPLHEYIDKNINNESHKNVWKYVGSMLMKEDILSFLQLWCNNPQMSEGQIDELKLEKEVETAQAEYDTAKKRLEEKKLQVKQ